MRHPLRDEWERIIRDGDAVGAFNRALTDAMAAHDYGTALALLEHVPKLESVLGRLMARFNGSYPRLAGLRHHLLVYHLPRKPT